MRVLIISTVGLKYEGITSVILANLRAMDRTDLNIYVAGTIELKASICEEIRDLGCKLVELPNRKDDTWNYLKKLTKFIRTNKIDVVHAHGNSATLAIEMTAAFFGGCRHRIAHSHNTRCEQVKADKMLRPLFYLFCNEALACGKDAGKWLFKNRPFTVISNGRDIEQYQFNESLRKQNRDKYNLHNQTVIGHVGGFLPQKNHEFLLDIFREIHEIRPDTIFVLVGDGELRADMEKKAEALGIRESVIFTGIINNVSELLQAMDGMLLPSKFEGLPLVAVEWQIAALPCVLSDSITRDCAFSDLVEFCSLREPAKKWAERILYAIDNKDRKAYACQVKKLARAAGFDIKDNAEILRNMYLR